jgi:hypothetical protein
LHTVPLLSFEIQGYGYRSALLGLLAAENEMSIEKRSPSLTSFTGLDTHSCSEMFYCIPKTDIIRHCDRNTYPDDGFGLLWHFHYSHSSLKARVGCIHLGSTAPQSYE